MKTVLLVEDNEDDAHIMKMACERAGIDHTLHVVTTGSEAIDYLTGLGAYANRAEHPLPDLIFLDLKLPGLSGHEVLTWIRRQPDLATLPVVVLTGSRQYEDVRRAYQLGATSYLQKEGDLEAFAEAVGVILRFWLEMNIVPAFRM